MLECGCVRFTRENKEGDGSGIVFFLRVFVLRLRIIFILKSNFREGVCSVYFFYILSVINLDILDTACRLDSSFNSNRDKIIRDYKEQVIVET